MPRVKRGPKRKNRRSKILKLAKGYYGMKSRGHRIAKEAVDKALNYAFTGRKDRKGDFRKLWITRINAAARQPFATTFSIPCHFSVSDRERAIQSAFDSSCTAHLLSQFLPRERTNC